MLYNEFLTGVNGSTWTNDLVNFPNFAKHLKSRFGRLELLYDEDTTLELLENVLIDYGVQLRQAEMLATVSFSQSDLGTSTASNSTTIQNNQGTNTLSYTGYNVDSDYNKNSSTNTGNAVSGSNLTTIDKLKETMEINNRESARLYDSVDKELYYIFRTLY